MVEGDGAGIGNQRYRTRFGIVRRSQPQADPGHRSEEKDRFIHIPPSAKLFPWENSMPLAGRCQEKNRLSS